MNIVNTQEKRHKFKRKRIKKLTRKQKEKLVNGRKRYSRTVRLYEEDMR